ncbi:TPA: hypothetical protein I8Y23_000144 [Raoultella planticola]|uniref:Haemolysin-type calcium binding-related domain-containing protein n=1 Tax=Raoultella planticola TaxID=575 RepID=A0AAN5KUG7_RAOPL|nr:hypothetical protein [Raoultella planticola]
MAKAISKFEKSSPLYDLIPDGDGSDFNCTTAASFILKSAGIDFLDSVQSPFGVAAKINGNNDYTMNDLVEDVLDAKDVIDNAVSHTYNSIRDKITELFGSTAESIPGEQAALANELLNLTESWLNTTRESVYSLFGEVAGSDNYPGSYFGEIIGHYKSLLDTLMSSIEQLLQGCPVPINIGGVNLFTPGFMDPVMGPGLVCAENQASPIIIDLDGDGIETLSVSSGVFFDHDGNQFAENTGWVAPDDGLLIFDRDGNGQIDSGSELFGNNTLLKSGKLAANGYQALQELDENKDGQLNSDDAIWASLRIWQDGNSNGRVDEGELLSLEEAGVAAIGTGYSTSQYVDEQGNAHRQTSTITRSDGAVGQSADVWFAANKGYSRYTGDVTLSAEIQALPYIRGFGNMADLHTAMSLNPQLIALVQQFVADPMAAKASGLIEKLLFTWAGVTDIAENSRGSYIDARQLAVLETAAGRGYRNTVNGTVNPLSSAAALLQDEYRRFAAYTEACLLATTVYASDFDFIHLQLSPDLSGLTLNFEAFEAHLNTLMQTDMGRYLQVSNVLYAWMEYLPSFADVRVRLGIPEALTFTGSDNADVVTGKNTNDVLWGGKGNDQLKGGYGDDTYLFNAGDGQDTIIESSGADTLRLGEGLMAEQAVLSRQRVQGYDSLVLGFRDRADSVIIQGYFSLDSYQVEQIVFADGTVWDVAAVKAMLLAGTAAAQSLQAYREGSEIHAGGGNDVLTGDSGNDALYGEAGDDTLDGSFGNDLLSGGTGNDLLKGGYGDDTYLFNAGDGQDTIIESSGADSLRLGEGLMAEQAVLSRQRVQGYDSLVLGFRDRADSVIIQGYFSLDSYQVEQIVFADGTVWDVAAVKAMLLAGTAAQSLQAYREGSEIRAGGGNDVLTGDSGNDALYGEAGDDTLDGSFGNDLLSGGTGNDLLKGGYGDDTYLFNAGDGQDTIIESSGTDTLRLGEGLLAEQAVLSRQRVQGYDSLVLGFRDRADSVIIQGYFSLDSYQVEQIVFADGTVWDVAAVKAMLLAGTEAAQSLQAYREGSEIRSGGGNDVLTGDSGNDALYGEAGDDTLDGSFGNDLLSGGTGNDLLKGGYGDDTYLFNAGDGQDTIIESSGADTLRMGEGLLAEQSVLSRQRVQGYDSLVLGFRDRADSVIIQGYFSLDSYQVEQIVFADGTVWDVAAVKAMLLAGTEAAQSLQAYREGSEIHAGGGNDVLTGDNGNDALYGEAGDDTLDGSFGNDLLSGGTGNDLLKGGYGDDTYLFNAGDGQDTIIESSGTDTLRLGEGLLAEQAVLSRQRVQGYDSLVLNFRDRADSVIIRGYFSLDSYQVEQIVFADDTLWLPEDVLNYIEHNIPLPVMDTAESTADIALLKQEICQFLASGDVDDADDAGVAIPLATAQTTAENWRTAVGY